MGLTVGIDVGGTKIAAGVVDEQGAILATARTRVAGDGHRRDRAHHRGPRRRAAGRPRRRRRSGVGGGRVRGLRRGRRCCSPPTWPGATSRCAADLEKRIGLPVVVENDANAAAWGEFTFGAGEDVEDTLLVTVGTGVGGGIVLNGELHRGAFGVARRDRAHARRAGRPAVRLRQPRLLGAVRLAARALVRDTREQARQGSLIARSLVDRAGGDVEASPGR